MGLINPSSGSIFFNGKEIDNKKYVRNLIDWRSKIAYVPQDIYLSDGSIKENIALGDPMEEIDLNRLKEASKIANIYEFIINCKNQFNTFVGERGIKLTNTKEHLVPLHTSKEVGRK